MKKPDSVDGPIDNTLPPVGDIIFENDGLQAKKCGDKCRGLSRCSAGHSPTCPDVNICSRNVCTSDTISGGCYPRFECDSYTCRGVALDPRVTDQLSGEANDLRKQMASRFSAYTQLPGDDEPTLN